MARPMPRPLISVKTLVPFSVTSPTFSLIFLLISILSVLSISTFLCASHRKSNKSAKHGLCIPCSGKKKLASRLNSSISSKALLMAKMVSWKKTEGGEEEEEEDDGDGEDSDEAIWRKTIIRGERCRPLDFSGKIDYDSEGNIVTS